MFRHTRRHSTSQRDGSQRAVGELRGLLVVSLASGSHTAALQWKADSTHGSVPWYVLNGVGGFFQVSLSGSRVWNLAKGKPTRVARPRAASFAAPIHLDVVSCVTAR